MSITTKAIVVLTMLVTSFSGVGTNHSFAQESNDKGLSLAESLRKAMQDAAQAGNYAEAVSAGKNLLGLLNDPTPERLSALEKLRSNSYYAGDVSGAREFASRVQELRSQLNGPDHWQVPSDKFHLEWLKKIAAQADSVQQKITKLEARVSQLLGTTDAQGRLDALKELKELENRFLDPSHPFAANSLKAIGGEHLNLGDNKSAIGALQQAIAIYEKAYEPTHPMIADTQSELGRALANEGRHAEAIPLFQKAANHLLQHQLKEVAASARQRLGHSLTDVGRDEEAIDAYRSAVELYQQQGLSYSQAFSLSSLGERLRKLGKHQEAADALSRSAALFSENKKAGFAASDLSSAAKSLFELGQYTLAIELFRSAHLNYQADGQLSNAAWMLKWIGDAYQRMDNLKVAASTYEQANQMFLDLKEWPALSTNATKLAELFTKLGNHQAAAAAYAMSIEAFAKQDKTLDCAKMHRQRGESLLRCDNYDGAEKVFAVASALLAESNDASELAKAMFGRGKALANLKRRSEAASLYQKSGEAFTKAEMPLESAMMHSWAGQVLLEDKQFEKADQNYQRFVPAIQKLNKPDTVALQLNYVAESWFGLKQYERAIHYAKIAGRSAGQSKDKKELLRSLFFVSQAAESLGESNSASVAESERFRAKLIELLSGLYQENKRPEFFLADASHREMFSNSLQRQIAKSIRENDDKTTSYALTSLAWLSEQKREFDFAHLCLIGQDFFRRNKTSQGEECIRIARIASAYLDASSVEGKLQLLMLEACLPTERDTALAQMEEMIKAIGERRDAFLERFQYFMFRAELASRQESEKERVGDYTELAFEEIWRKFPTRQIPPGIAAVVEINLRLAASLPGAVVSDPSGAILEILSDMTKSFSQPDYADDLAMAWHFAAKSFASNSQFEEQTKMAIRKAYAEAKRTDNRELVSKLIDSVVRLQFEEVENNHELVSVLPTLEERLTLRLEQGDQKGALGSQLDLATANAFLGNTQEAIDRFRKSIDLLKKLAPNGAADRPSSFGFVKTSLLDEHGLSYIAKRFVEKFPSFGDDAKPTTVGWATWTPGPANPLSIAVPDVVGWMSLTNNPDQVQVDWYRGLAGMLEATQFRTHSIDAPWKPFMLAGQHVFSRSDRFPSWLSQSTTDFDLLRELEKDARTLLVHDAQFDHALQGNLKLSDRARELAKLMQRMTLSIRRNDSSGLTLELQVQLSSVPQQSVDVSVGLTECLITQLTGDFGQRIESNDFSRVLRETFANASWRREKETVGATFTYFKTQLDLTPTQIRSFTNQMDLAMKEAKRISQLMLLKNQVKQASLAVISRFIEDRKWPQAFSVDSDGKPLLSWRVHLLPHLGDEEAERLYKEFHLNEPWDSPHNHRLISKIPSIYRSPSIGEGRTPFLLVTGPGTLWHSGGKPVSSELSKAPSLLMVTVDDSESVVWTKPQDVVVDKERLSMPRLSSLHPEGAPVAMTNGEYRLADPSARPEWFHYWSQTEHQPLSDLKQKGPEYFFAGHEAAQLAQKQRSALADLEELGRELGYFRIRRGRNLHPSIITDDRYDCLAQYSVDKVGKPLLSWRVHLLPFLGHKTLYEKFRLDEPWDSQANRNLLSEMPDVYCHPEDHSTDGKTRYQMLIGKGTDYETRVGPAKKDSWRHKVSRNIALVCTPRERAVEWTRPSDFDVSEFKVAVKNLISSRTSIDCVLDNAAVFQIDNSVDIMLINDWITTEIEIRSPEQKLQHLNVALDQWANKKRSDAPSVVKNDSESKLSWRVHVLPYLGLTDLYEKFRLDEPWDSEHNRILLGKMPDIYSLSKVDAASVKTAIVRLTGPGTATNALATAPLSYNRGHESIRLLTVKSEYQVPWTQPFDLEIPENYRIRDGRFRDSAVPSTPPFQGVLLEMAASDFHHSLMEREIRTGLLYQTQEIGVPLAFADFSTGTCGLMSPALPPEVWQKAMSVDHGIESADLKQANIEVSKKARLMKLPSQRTQLPAILLLAGENSKN